MDLYFASHNPHKKQEFHAILEAQFTILGLDDLGINTAIEETGQNLEENALIKARSLAGLGYSPCIADDSGLEVNALGGAPGVLSARYSGVHGDHLANMNKLLMNLSTTKDRTARFRTVIALIFNAKEYIFEGYINGTISHSIEGSNGFGYDPIFIPTGSELSFGQMPVDRKLQMSHRSMAIYKLVEFLNTIKVDEN